MGEASAELVFGVPLPDRHNIEFEALEDTADDKCPQVRFHGNAYIGDMTSYLGYVYMESHEGQAELQARRKVLEELHWRPRIHKIWEEWHREYDRIYENLDKDPLPKEPPEPMWYLISTYT